ncbi:hypothetical protein [Corynebacterium heidelbergense]|uniref:hypothetical protein n=1 Tax=Corynebacterium heidelbergense TaxID=2055947 RepID=UPI0010583610|nr:hypothetical protein [Corynebacterium heidelbergense]
MSRALKTNGGITISALQLVAPQTPGLKVAGAMIFAALGTPSGTGFPEHQKWAMKGHPMTFAALDLTCSAKTVREAALGAVSHVDGEVYDLPRKG